MLLNIQEKKETENEDLAKLPGGVTALKIDGMSAAVTDAINSARTLSTRT